MLIFLLLLLTIYKMVLCLCDRYFWFFHFSLQKIKLFLMNNFIAISNSQFLILSNNSTVILYFAMSDIFIGKSRHYLVIWKLFTDYLLVYERLNDDSTDCNLLWVSCEQMLLKGVKRHHRVGSICLSHWKPGFSCTWMKVGSTVATTHHSLVRFCNR